MRAIQVVKRHAAVAVRVNHSGGAKLWSSPLREVSMLRGSFDTSLVVGPPRTVLELAPHADLRLRYWSLVDDNGGVWFSARAGFHALVGGFRTYLLREAVSGAAPLEAPILFVNDSSVSHNLVVKRHGSRFHVFGGTDLSEASIAIFETAADNLIRWNAQYGVVDARVPFVPDGVQHLVARSFASLRDGATLHPRHGPGVAVFRGSHAGCYTARRGDGICEFDGKLSAAFFRGTWHVFVRQNLRRHGGRFVAVLKSTAGAAGPYQSHTHTMPNSQRVRCSARH